jgi:hypothetical protein
MTFKSPISRRAFLGAISATGLLPALPAAAMMHSGAPRKDRLVVVELFTSQGCSACPPADAFMLELAKRPDILALTYNVDYWDYLGWRDTLGSPDFTRRQQRYAKARGDSLVYTPQMIINGRHHVIGNKRDEVLKLIEQEKKEGDCRHVDLTLTDANDMLQVKAGPAPDKLKGREATLWVATAMKEVKVEIEKGENRGKELMYCNVVRKIVPAAMWKGKETSVSLPRSELFVNGAQTCAALLQLDEHGPIIGAARLGM